MYRFHSIQKQKRKLIIYFEILLLFIVFFVFYEFEINNSSLIRYTQELDDENRTHTKTYLPSFLPLDDFTHNYYFHFGKNRKICSLLIFSMWRGIHAMNNEKQNQNPAIGVALYFQVHGTQEVCALHFTIVYIHVE